MQNPYEVLGIKEGASQEEIRAAYREQVKKYHPDKHQDNPLYELAEEKLQEINEAYDYLTKNQGNGGNGYTSNNSYNGNGNSGNNGYRSTSSEFADIRRTIDSGNVLAAETMLNKIKNRNSEWFFLRGMISLRRGWYDDAMANVQTAISMEPNNMEYRNALNSIMATGNGYRTSSFGRGYTSNDELCRMLQCYCCADALCDCF